MKLHIPDKPETILEEVFNSITHGLGLAAGIVGLILGYLSLHAPLQFKIAFLVYAASLILLMLASTLYHSLMFTKARSVFAILDHSSIFILIAGSFTPFIVHLYTDWLRIVLLALVWAMAIFGVVLKAAMRTFANKIGVIPYVCMGWLGLLLVPKLHALSPVVLYLLVGGGLLYTAGIVLLLSSKRFTHATWHLFVIAAAVTHYFAILQLHS